MLAGLQLPPLLHATQAAALLQTIPVPHDVPAGLLALSTQTSEPVLHEFVPFLHGLVGWHAVPAVQDTHIPRRHTRLVPQPTPSATDVPASVQTATPVSQASVPLWQGFAGVQVAPAVQVVQAPSVQTLLVPHEAPAGALPTSTQADTPIAHDMRPALQALAG